MNKPIDLGKPVQTREGQSARIICTNAEKGAYSVIALVKAGGSETVLTYTSEGRFHSTGAPAPADLVNVPVEHTQVVWLNCYPAREPVPHQTEEQARECASSNCLAIVKVVVKFKEGDGL